MAGEQSGSFEVREYLAFRSHMFTRYACCYCCWQLTWHQNNMEPLLHVTPPWHQKHMCAMLTSLQQLTSSLDIFVAKVTLIALFSIVTRRILLLYHDPTERMLYTCHAAVTACQGKMPSNVSMACSATESRFLQASMAAAVNKPIISDEEYDELKAKLRNKNSKVVQQVGRCSPQHVSARAIPDTAFLLLSCEAVW